MILCCFDAIELDQSYKLRHGAYRIKALEELGGNLLKIGVPLFGSL